MVQVDSRRRNNLFVSESIFMGIILVQQVWCTNNRIKRAVIIIVTLLLLFVCTSNNDPLVFLVWK